MKVYEEKVVPIGQLKEDPDNANSHDEAGIAAIAASLKKFQQVEALVVQRKSNVVIGGHGRLDAMRRLGWKSVLVKFVDVTESERKALAIALNQTPRMSRFDDTRLLEQLQEIQAADSTGLLDATGFNLEDIEDLRHLLEEDHAKKAGDGLPRGEGGSIVTCPKCGTVVQVGVKDA